MENIYIREGIEYIVRTPSLEEYREILNMDIKKRGAEPIFESGIIQLWKEDIEQDGNILIPEFSFILDEYYSREYYSYPYISCTKRNCKAHEQGEMVQVLYACLVPYKDQVIDSLKKILE